MWLSVINSRLTTGDVYGNGIPFSVEIPTAMGMKIQVCQKRKWECEENMSQWTWKWLFFRRAKIPISRLNVNLI